MYFIVGFDFGVGIKQANLDGSDVKVIYEGGNYEPERLDIHPEAAKLYWTTAGGVFRSDLDGKNPEALADLDYCGAWGIAVEPVNAKLYWSAPKTNGYCAQGKLQRSNLDGTHVENMALLAPGVFSEVRVFPIQRSLVWSDAYSIRRALLDGSEAESVIPTGSQYGGPLAVDPRPFPADLHAFAAFQNCLGTVDVSTSECSTFESSGDNQVDLADYERLLATFAGP
jgi:hypothetical protein